MKKIRYIVASGLIIAALGATAAEKSLADQQQDSLSLSHRIIMMDGSGSRTVARDSMRQVIDKFYYDQFRHFQDPAAPYFLFMSKDSHLAMGVGGVVRLRGWFDWDNTMPGANFSPYQIPTTADPTSPRHLGVSPSGTGLFFKILGRHDKIGDYQLYIEGDFGGYNGMGFRLKKAYATVNDWTVGYAKSTFSDPAAEAPTVEAAGPTNKIGATNMLVRWMHTFKSHYVVAASVEFASSQPEATDQYTKPVADWVPDVAAFVQYEWGPTDHVRLSGLLRTLSYRDIAVHQNRNNLGWGVQLTSVFHPAQRFTVYSQINAGKGIESYGAELSQGNLDLMGTPGRPGRMYAPTSWGWYAGLQYNIRPDLFISGVYSQTHFCPDTPIAAGTYKRGDYLAINAFWSPIPRVQIGIEYDYAVRHSFGIDKAHAHRIGTVASFSF